jgi:hypothetical protein
MRKELKEGEKEKNKTRCLERGRTAVAEIE